MDICNTCGKVFGKKEYRINCTGCDTYYCDKCAREHIDEYEKDGFSPIDIEHDEDFYITEICHCKKD